MTNSNHIKCVSLATEACQLTHFRKAEYIELLGDAYEANRLNSEAVYYWKQSLAVIADENERLRWNQHIAIKIHKAQE